MDGNPPAMPTTNPAPAVCPEIYHKLRAMFPHIHRDYLKRFCPTEWSPAFTQDVHFASIVDNILANEPHWQLEPEENQECMENLNLNVDETLDYLTEIFPDADPEYLHQAATGFTSKIDIDTFVNEHIQNPDYPTRENYLTRLKTTQEQDRYMKHFNVSDFLKIIPDPFGHFENPARVCTHDPAALDILKIVFKLNRAADIDRYYNRCRYNMSLTGIKLRKCKSRLKHARYLRIIPTENINLLQEMAFLQHYDEIRQYMTDIVAREMQEFDELKATNGLLQCQCCFDEECVPSKCSTCENNHNFCNSCVIAGTNSTLGDGETHVMCFLSCGSEFSLSTLQKIIAPTTFSILLKKRQAAEVEAAGLEGLVACPFCHFASIPAEHDKIFKCLNPECMKQSCIACKKLNHLPERCNEEIRGDNARKYIEEKMTQALARVCYQCKKVFFKEEGCNKINCPCGAMMCFICNQPIKDYKHFRGQGSDDLTKCPLWSDNQLLNAEIVRKVAKIAQNELLKADPTLKINTELLAPVLPAPTAGPHDTDIVSTEKLAVELAARVMQNGIN